jgi:hypothetical protein
LAITVLPIFVAASCIIVTRFGAGIDYKYALPCNHRDTGARGIGGWHWAAGATQCQMQAILQFGCRIGAHAGFQAFAHDEFKNVGTLGADQDSQYRDCCQYYCRPFRCLSRSFFCQLYAVAE